MNNIAIFASGSGSNFDAIVQKVEKGELDVNIALLVCDRIGAPVIEKAQKYEIDTVVYRPKSFSDKSEYERAVLDDCRKRDVEFIVLAGYMRLIGPTLLQPFEQRIINIHPSLLPAFPGKDAIGQALEKRVKVTGVTIHFVDGGMDTGPIIAQEAIEVSDADTAIDIKRKIQAVEHRLYPKVIQSLFIKEESQ
ncbi:phosphoribosylglycinamide formyltransferase-1 [Halobacillus karajensis]|uniref:Phosphoribosylglycinamide formyltransferase n=1 Tax=Halobacillus karajensis TaxID=195088 RepID=A0A024P5H8_9BACI|nr:phosphoribosylglycinamide formyltransferase [Halobacillus karajensis]CDQ20619.1 Phosphoribosylglycinamide formyltransferase [Halobacillus karajensis]CDQ23911.1 Phosphoribosylglycinamide formyltransferase [Halobacillus karajensis]CDQ27389.1 Phosphoribosylglycinamide formyltransferase [Halobacillus karajensis]SEH88633.1 phosphoribosylglycinamide formyltransferase-1 [Halobacillus karajensis]